MGLRREVSGKIFARFELACEDAFHCLHILCTVWVIFNLKSKMAKIPDACWEKEGYGKKITICLELSCKSGVDYGWLCGPDT